MKSAEERAKDIADHLGLGKHDTMTRDYIRVQILEAFRDQRHACAEEVLRNIEDAEMASRAHAIVMNTPEPR